MSSNGKGKQAPGHAEWPAYVYKPNMEKGWDIARNCIETTARAQSDLSQLMHDQMSLLTNGLTKTLAGDTSDAVDKVVKSAKRP